MKRVLLYAFACSVLLQGCSKEEDLYNPSEAIRENVENVFGTSFNSNQDWNMLKSGEVTITANADLDDIATVQILTASPFGNSEAKILNEVAVTKGETVKLNFDAPANQARLYAACVSHDKRYRIKGFEIGQSTVVFTNANARATRATTRAYDVPTSTPKISTIVNSLNAFRAASTDETFQLWQQSGWKDYLVSQDNGSEQSQIQEIADLNDEEKADLRDIFFTYLPEKGDNINKIRQSDIFTTDNNYLTSTGEPISFAYVHCGTLQSHIGSVHLYYYYFKPEQLDALESEAEKIQFLKDLPKYKASQAWRTYSNESGYDDLTKRKHLLTLPYYGDDEPTIGKTGSWDFPAGYKIGFIMRRANNNTEWNSTKTGCLYSDGRLNQEINQFGFFGEAGLAPTDPRTAIFGANGKNYMCFEDGNDRDFNDLIIEFESGVKVIDDQINLDKNVYTFAFEDRDLGDYDLNDVVIKAQRIDLTHVKYSLEACGANDRLYLRNINGKVLNDSKEIHALFNVSTSQFVNTQSNHIAPVQETVEVASSFSFANKTDQAYIHNDATGKDIHIAEKGEDPHAILIPYDFKYPLEQVCVKDAYLQFNNWGESKISSTDWYLYPENSKVYQTSVFR